MKFGVSIEVLTSSFSDVFKKIRMVLSDKCPAHFFRFSDQGTFPPGRSKLR